MAKASPHVSSFNAGEFSRLMEGRVDIDRYRASMRKLYNGIAAPQGPFLARSGTMFMGPAFDHTKRSGLIPFTFNEEQSLVLEFSHLRMRLWIEAGLVTRSAVAVTAVANVGGFLRVTSPLLDALVGDELTLAGFPAETGLNGLPVVITAVAGTNYTLAAAWPSGLVYDAGMQAARVFSISTPYAESVVGDIRYVQSGPFIYLLCDSIRPYKLQRYSAYDWRLTPVKLIDGPFGPVNTTGTRLTPDGTGGVYVAPSVSGLGLQTGTLIWDFVSAVTVNGYTIYLPRTLNTDANYSLLDQAPSTWSFEGSNDGFTWTLLDEQVNYVLYDNYKSVFFEVKNVAAFRYYKLNVVSCRRNGPIQPVIAVPGFQSVIFSTTQSNIFTINASSTTGINQDRGFLTTDVGRLLRYKSSDGNWATLEIVEWIGATTIRVRPQSGPISNTKGTADWRLGLFSDTTGYPICGTFFEDRLWLAGAREAPDSVCGSVTGAYERFSQTSEAGVVADDNAVVAVLNSRKFSRAAWLGTDERALQVGTGSAEWAVTAGEREGVITARSIKSRQSTARGSAMIEPVKVDRQLLFVQRSKRTVREFAYVFEADGYKSPSMSLFASHIGTAGFEELEYAAEPHSIMWARRADGLVPGLTYNREENVIGWHVQEFPHGFVESMTVIPSQDGTHDMLWLAVRRTINGQTRRYIERLTRFWDFDMTIDDAHFVDCGLRYEGAPVSTVYIPHLAGHTIVGLYDGSILPETEVPLNGRIDLPLPASNIVIGLPFDGVGCTSRLEAGAADGTAQGKTKRIHKATVRLWQSGGGFIGRAEDDMERIHMRDGENMSTEPLPLVDQDVEIEWSDGYDTDAYIWFKRPGNIPLPFNVIAVMPQVVTQDAA